MAPSTVENYSSEQEDELPALQSKPNILNNPDLMILPDNEAGQVYTPPAHIAARFYRPSLNRRRSSAASSRRNSLASSHSRHSNSSYRKAFQSNHVAQYLRRASIIEGRKARLAAKEAHAEQVRLRAALAKATPRISNSEERALAATQAREKYLAKVAAACAEEVNRAKKVAEENRERKAEAERRCRMEIEEKHAEAERRRLEYKRTSRKTRSTSFATGDGKKTVEDLKAEIDTETAVSRIQAAWRFSQKRKTVSAFVALNLSIGQVQEATFEDATALLADEKIIAATGKILNALGLEDGTKENAISIRTFLSAYMILGHPADIFSKTGQQEQDLIDKTKELLITFEALLPKISSSIGNIFGATDLETLSQDYSTYLTAFHAWKSQDASVLIGTMIDQFVALDEIWQTVKDSTRGEVAADYREGIRDQQILLLSKIKKLAGPERANTLIKKAIRESRRSKTRQRPAGDLRPRPALSQDQSAETTSAETINQAVAVTQIAEEPSSAKPEDYELTELSKVFSIVPPNRVLVHELVLDPGFKIEVEPQSDHRSALNRKVCESMRQGVLDGQGDVWTVAVAENIRKRLLKLLKPTHSMQPLVSEVLDPDHVRNQCRQNMFSYEKFFHFMADILPRLCAPFRDTEVQAYAQTLKSPGTELDAMIEKLFGLFHIIDLMSLDYTNYMLQQAAPTLIAEAPGYEQRVFAQDLESGTITLQRTKRWWRNASVNILTENIHNRDGDFTPQPTLTAVYARGLVDLVVAVGPLPAAEVPETLHLDATRLAAHRTTLARYITVGAILLTAKNLLKRDVRTHWKPEARRLHDLLTPPADADADAASAYANPSGALTARILAIIDAAHPMPQASRDHLAAFTSRFLAAAGDPSAATAGDPVLKLLHARLRAHVFARLAAASAAERVRVAATASESLAMIGLCEVVGEVGRVAESLGKVMRVDLESHGSWYDVVRGEAEAGGAMGAS